MPYASAVPKDRAAGLAFLAAFVEGAKASGFVAASLERHGTRGLARHPVVALEGRSEPLRRSFSARKAEKAWSRWLASWSVRVSWTAGDMACSCHEVTYAIHHRVLHAKQARCADRGSFVALRLVPL